MTARPPLYAEVAQARRAIALDAYKLAELRRNAIAAAQSIYAHAAQDAQARLAEADAEVQRLRVAYTAIEDQWVADCWGEVVGA